MYSMVDQDGNIAIGWNPNGNNLSDPSFNSRHLEIKKLVIMGFLLSGYKMGISRIYTVR